MRSLEKEKTWVQFPYNGHYSTVPIKPNVQFQTQQQGCAFKFKISESKPVNKSSNCIKSTQKWTNCIQNCQKQCTVWFISCLNFTLKLFLVETYPPYSTNYYLNNTKTCASSWELCLKKTECSDFHSKNKTQTFTMRLVVE